MSAAWCAALAPPGRVLALSAGTAPAPHVHPLVADAMREVGIELDKPPEKLTDALVARTDVVVTMGCEDDVYVEQLTVQC